jgi:hypothetical protein
MESGEKKTAATAGAWQASVASAASTEASACAHDASGLRAYEPPRLRHLGSVRALTLGATGRRGDINGGRQAAPSSRDFKENVHYLTPEEKSTLAAEVLGLKLATYDYKDGLDQAPGRHLGFIIEDAPTAKFVRASEKVVDVYGFASALAAVVQNQQTTIARLEAELGELKAKLPR